MSAWVPSAVRTLTGTPRLSARSTAAAASAAVSGCSQNRAAASSEAWLLLLVVRPGHGRCHQRELGPPVDQPTEPTACGRLPGNVPTTAGKPAFSASCRANRLAAIAPTSPVPHSMATTAPRRQPFAWRHSRRNLAVASTSTTRSSSSAAASTASSACSWPGPRPSDQRGRQAPHQRSRRAGFPTPWESQRRH